MNHEYHDLAASMTIEREVEPRTSQILYHHMKDFVDTATPEEMAMAANEDTDEEALGGGEESQSDGSSDECSQ